MRPVVAALNWTSTGGLGATEALRSSDVDVGEDEGDEFHDWGPSCAKQ